MRIRPRSLVGLVAAAAVIAAIALVAFRGGGGSASPGQGEPAASATPRAAAVRAEPHTIAAISMAAPFDDDPIGALRLEGQVIDAGDQPVGDAIVVIDANPPRETRTEADGSFAFDRLTPRTYRVGARASDGSAGPIAVRLTQRTEPVVLQIRAAGSIAVTVTSGGVPVRGAIVELRDLVSATAISDDAGLATVRGVGPGWHVIKASADGHAAAFREVLSSGEGELKLAIALRAGAAVAGTVVDLSGAPIEGARVHPEPLSHVDDFYDARFDAVLTDAKGRWRLTGLPRETTRIRASHAAYAPAASSPLVLGDGGDRTGVTIALDRGGRVRGRVLDASGAPAPGAEVRIAADTMITGHVRRVATDAAGQFSMGGLPRTAMYAIAASDGASSKIAMIDLTGREPAPIELALDHGAALAGIVVTRSGVPVPDARLLAERVPSSSEHHRVEDRLRGSASAIAGTDGRFRISGLPAGTYSVRAVRPGSSIHLLRAQLGVPIETGSDARVIVDDLSAIIGRVAFASGKPVPRFAIQLGTSPPRWFSADDGAFRVDEVPAGKQFVRVSGPDVVTRSLPDVVVEADRATDLATITVQAGRAISGSVVDRAGRPVAGATVAIGPELRADGASLVPYPLPDTLQVATGADGRFTIRGIASGKREIAAEHDTAGRSAMASISPGTADVELTLAIQPPGVVQGFVRMNGKPIEAVVLLRAAAAPDSRVTVRTGLDGSYRFDRVAPGRYSHWTAFERGRADSVEDGKLAVIDVPSEGVVNHDVDLTQAGVTVVLRITSPGNAVRYGYGFVATGDELIRTMPVPKTISEARALATQLQRLESKEGQLVDRQIKLEHVPPGAGLSCVVPFRGDPKDPAVAAELQNLHALPLYCKRSDIPAAPELQTVTVEVGLPPPPPK